MLQPDSEHKIKKIKKKKFLFLENTRADETYTEMPKTAC